MKPRPATLMLFLMAVALNSGCQNIKQAVAKLDADAAQATKEAIVPRLQKLGVESPTDSPAAADTVNNWDLRTEDINFDVARPLIGKWLVLHPEDEGATRVMRRWAARLHKTPA